MPNKKEYLPLKVDGSDERSKIDVMEILSPMHFDLAMAVLKIRRKDEIAKKTGIGITTLNAIYGVIERKVTIDKRIEVKNNLDSVIGAAGWEFIQGGGIRKIKEKK